MGSSSLHFTSHVDANLASIVTLVTSDYITSKINVHFLEDGIVVELEHASYFTSLLLIDQFECLFAIAFDRGSAIFFSLAGDPTFGVILVPYVWYCLGLVRGTFEMIEVICLIFPLFWLKYYFKNILN